ncbi:MAG: energy transducer TonB [Chitinispirillales bacterium]|jgi:hypothetical protein|nr:energy transducer TonB [Chitinispirillales bacterium]
MNKIAPEEYFSEQKSNDSQNFIISFIVVILMFCGGFYYLSKIEIMPKPVHEKITTLKTTFSINQEKKKETPKPIDLGEKPKITKIQEFPKEVSEVKPENREIKKVYGLQKVYSTRLGTGGSMANAVVGKFGNAINKDFDTITASQTDIMAKEAVSPASVTHAPSFKKRVKPEISEEIRKSGVSGTIKVKVLIDIDGKVKKAVAENDLGFGTLKSAIDACFQMEFTPARIGDEIVAVWITIPIRFEKL